MSEQTLQKDVDTQENQGVDYESLASKMGWAPKEKFKGAAEKWVDAQTFYENGEKVLPIVKAQNKVLQAELDKAKKDIEEVRQTAKDFEKFTKDSLERDYQKKVAELEARKALAIESGDGKEVVAVDREIRDLKKPEPPKEEKKDEGNPYFNTWVAENDWYQTNREMRLEADAIGVALTQQGIPLDKVMVKVREKIERLYPEQFETQERASPQRPKANGHNPKARSYENLPADAKATCDRFLKSGFIKNKEQYLEQYDWS